MDDIEAPAERGDAQPWLDRLDEAEKAMAAWQTAADNIDKAYADLSQLRATMRDREFQLFWSNIQVMGPSIYARAPVPVVTPKFKDRRPLYRTASEFLERCCNVSFDLADIDQPMIAMRDDLAIAGRGAPWVRYESDDDGERVCYEHIERKDFRHDPARKWREVDWVSARAWLDRDDMRKRFGDAASEVSYSQPRNERGQFASKGASEKCGVWEIWCKSKNRVIWVAEGCQKVLDEAPPHLKLAGFFPCPRPAYATLQRGSLVPVPDMLLYKDQLEEVNDLTRRIHALSDAVKVRGFYAAGGDVGAAIERAILLDDERQILVPIPAMQQLMQGSGDPIIWLPLDLLTQTITGMVELRRQVIEDVYQIIGLSDIMRGSVDPNEKLGQSRLKQQNGSYRVRDKQNELVRVARDMVRLGAEIMAEQFGRQTLEDMAQMDLPTDKEIKDRLEDMRKKAREELEGLMEMGEREAQKAAAQAQQQGQQFDPQQAVRMFEEKQREVTQRWASEMKKVGDTVTIDQVMAFLKDEKLRPFVLDIETDSTIYPDEAQEKASRAEFMAAFSTSMQALTPMMAMGPEAVGVAGGVFKFALAPYRVGRELEGLIDDFVDQGPQIAKRLQEQQSQGQSEQMAQAALKLSEAEAKKAEAATMKVQADAQAKQQDMELRMREAQTSAQQDQQRFALEIEDTKGKLSETGARIEKIWAEIQKLGIDARNQTRTQDREDVKAAADIQSRARDQQMSEQDRARAAFESDRAATMGERQQSFSEKQGQRAEDRADRQQDFNERQTEDDVDG